MSPEEIQAIFFVECEESLEAAEQGLAACRDGTQDDDTVNAVFRAVHSIKGGAGAFGFTELQGFTHTFETLLSDVRDGTLPLSDSLTELMLRALDTLSDHVAAAREDGTPPEDGALLAELVAAQGGQSAPATAAAGPAPSAAPAPAPAVTVSTAASESCDPADFDLASMLDSISDEISPDNQLAGSDPEWQCHIRPHSGALANGSEPVLLLRELAALGGHCVTCDSSAIPPPDLLVPGEGYLGWSFSFPPDVSEDRVREVFDFLGDDCSLTFGRDAAMPPVRLELPTPAANTPAPQPTAGSPAAVAPVASATTPASAPAAGSNAASKEPAEKGGSSAPGPSIRIDLAKLDRLVDTVGEVVIAQAMLAQRLMGEGLAGIEELAMLESLTRDIQESAMAIRAQPIGSVFSRVPRILRELASSTGKHVKLEVIGEGTELDKTVIERLGEPLTHLIRNAVDHGIESADARMAAGKNPEGTLTLSAEHRSGRILIKIADDGAGINRERVWAKALEKGLVTPETQMPDEDIDNLIFAPGFSTAQVVSSISGRGVGMDVVRQNVKDLGGRITIESEPGKGTTFTMALPLTLAISDGMIVTVGDQTLVVPLAHVVESLRPGEGHIQGLGAGRHMLNVRGRFIPVLPLRDTVGAAGATQSPEEGVLIVVDTEAAGKAALMVDAISDQRQFVIKSLDTHYRSVEGVAGATILGDGRVALILDVDSLVTRALDTAAPQAALAA